MIQGLRIDFSVDIQLNNQIDNQRILQEINQWHIICIKRCLSILTFSHESESMIISSLGIAGKLR